MQVDPELVDALLARAHQRAGGAGARRRPPRWSPAGRADIEAPYLQLMMTRLWELERARGSPRLTAETLAAVGTVSEIVRAHVDGHMGRISRRQRDVAAAVFHQLVTPSGAKVARSLDDLAAYTKLPRERIQALLTTLSQSDWLIVRAVAADESGVAVLRDLPRRPRRSRPRLASPPRGAPAHPEDRPDRDRRGRRPRPGSRSPRWSSPRTWTRRPTGRPPPSAQAEDAQREAAAARERRWRDWRSGRTRTRRSSTHWRRPRARGRTRRRSRCGKRWPATVSRRGSRPAHRTRCATSKSPRRAPPCDRGQGRHHPCVGSGEPRRRPLELKGDGRNVAFDRSGERVAVAGGAGDGLERRRAAAGRSRRRTAERGRASRGVPTAGRLAAGGDGQAKVWSSLERSPRTLDTAARRGRPHRVESRRPTASPPSRAAASEIWTREGKPLATVPRRGKVVSVAFSPDGTRVLVARADGAVDVLGGSRRPLPMRGQASDEGHCGRLHGTMAGISSRARTFRATRGPRRSAAWSSRASARRRLIALPEGVRITSVVAGGRGQRDLRGRPTIDQCGSGTPSATPSWRRCPGWGRTRNSSPAGRPRTDPMCCCRPASNGTIRLWRPGVVPLARFDVKRLGPRGGVRHDRRAACWPRRRAWRAFEPVGRARPSMTLHGPALGPPQRARRRRHLARRSSSKSGVRILDVDGGRSLRLPAPAVTSLNFSPDGSPAAARCTTTASPGSGGQIAPRAPCTS